MSFVSEIKKAGNSDHATGVLYAGLAGLLLSDVIPTPADAAYFLWERKNRNNFMQRQITAKQYWEREALGYYGFNILWWMFVIGVTVAIKGDAKRKLTVAGGLIGSGAVVAVLAHNIKQDEQNLKQAA